MNRLDQPFNIEILNLNDLNLEMLKPVTVLDFFERANGQLHEDGLFSISIFGRMGDEVRDERFSYISIKTQVFHPLIYKSLMALRAFYKEIVAGTRYAIWNDDLKDFEPATELNGRTGFAFFTEHWERIEFRSNKSPKREMRIKMIEKYKAKAMVDKIVVMPAGLRDIEIGDDNRTVVGEVNDFYKRILSVAGTIPDSEHAKTDPTYDRARLMLQRAFSELYDFLSDLLAGKGGFMQAKWGSRRIVNGTRNVITAMDTSTKELGNPHAPRITDTIVGLYQLSKSILPVSIHLLKEGPLQQTVLHNGMMRLIDPRTLLADDYEVSPTTYDRFATVEGIERLITSYEEVELRNKPVMADGRYVALIYVPKDQPVFKIFHGMDEFPDDPRFRREDVRPINLVELIYLSGYKRWNDYCGFVTRYPVTSPDSCYPTTVYTKTTIVGESRWELDLNWERTENETPALEFPTYDPLAYLDSLVIPSARLKGLVADFDGDTASFNAVYSDEAVAEVKRVLDSKMAYVDPRGGFRASTDVETVALVLRNMTGHPKP